MPNAVPPNPFRLVGYLPDYRVAGYDSAAAKPLTDLVHFGAVPTPAGELGADKIAPAAFALLDRIRGEHGVRLHLCLGGWGRSGGFARLAATPAARRRLANEAAAFCVQRGFAGIDVDWEHPQSPAERTGHAALLAALKAALAPHALRLTIAAAGWQELLPETIAAVDALHLMAYDEPGRHATFESAVAQVERWAARGVPAEKIVLGLPFYGRDPKNADRAEGYGDIVRRHRPAHSCDEAGGLCFNGRDTLLRKIKLVRERKLAGAMAWEVGQDAPGADALLPALRRALDER